MNTGLEGVFFQNRAALLRFVRARGAADAAEDMLQDLWLRAAAGASGPIADPLAYLYRTANNLMLDRRRSELRRGRREREWADVEGLGSEASDAPSGERMLIARDELRTAQDALSGLGERTETIFRKFRLEGVTQQQIADELGISLSAVEKHLQKAYRALMVLRSQSDADSAGGGVISQRWY